MRKVFFFRIRSQALDKEVLMLSHEESNLGPLHIGKEPVGCGSEMDIDVWAKFLLLCTFRPPMSPNTPEFVYIWISSQDITYKN